MSEGPKFKPVNFAVFAGKKKYVVLQVALMQMLVINLLGGVGVAMSGMTGSSRGNNM